ncbi:transposase [Methylorubrum salsuginis]|uniref:Transposase DDE domain-containing protein n=1 Tax=Methylorubrum salsuginis TaxID=414703 RepID=A0A1I4HJ36_9HYPH|nr:transposase [Methylorubrum salsuginis]SFL41541.1 Transposase DDE domain-containing protein [Methylorubrum salsuginis]
MLTNHPAASAVEIATLYERHWQIEPVFRWLDQPLRIRHFLGQRPAAIQLQLYAALIAFALVHLTARRSRFAGSMLRFQRLIDSVQLSRAISCRSTHRDHRDEHGLRLSLPSTSEI